MGPGIPDPFLGACHSQPTGVHSTGSIALDTEIDLSDGSHG
jgi:hypothetical protein